MVRTPKNLARHETIGLIVEVVKSTDPGVVGIKGKVVDETQSMLTIETEEGDKKVLKKECTFKFFLEEDAVEVEGKVLEERPHERTKSVRKK